MAVHLLFRPAPAAPPPTPVSPVRRSARLGPHSSTPPSLSGRSTSPTKPAASPSAKQRAAKGHISPIPNTRKRARPSEPQPQLHLQSDESDSEPPSAHATAAAIPLAPPLTPGPTPRSIRAQKRQKVSPTTDVGQQPSDQGPTTSSLTPLTPATVPKTRAAKRKSLVIDDDGEINALLQEPEPLPMARASKRKRNENASQPVRSSPNGRKAKLKATPLTTTTRGRASSQVQLTGDNNLPHVKSTKGKERAREDDILPGPIPNPKVVSLRWPRRSTGGLNSTDLFASSSIPAGASSVHGLNSKNDISSSSSNTTAIPQLYSKDVPRTTRTTRAKARELLSLESNESMMPDTTPTLTSSTSTSSSPRLGPLTQTMGIVLNTNVLSLALNQAPTIAGSKPGNSSQTTEPTSPSQTTKSTGRQPHIHFHSPLTPLAHTTSTTPPGSPTLSARVSPPLDAVDLGLVLGGGGEGGGSSTSTNNSAATSPTASANAVTPPSSPSSSSGTNTTSASDPTNTVAAPVSGGLFPNPILLPSIPTAAAAFLGAQEMPEQQRCIQPFNFPPTSPTEELGAPPPSPAAHVQTHPLPNSSSSSSSTSTPEVMNIAREILDVGFQEASVDIARIPMNAPLSVSSIPASESELGFGFHPQEGFSSTTGIPSLGSSSSSASPDHQQQQQTSQEQPEQRIYAQDTSTEQYQYPPGYEERQQVQQEAQPAQQQNHHTTPVLLKQRKLTYPDPLPLEHAPRIERDGSLWKTACKLRVFELLRHYPPDIIRSVVAQDAHTYYAARDTFPLGYNMSESERRRLLYKKLGLVSLRNTRSKLHQYHSLPTSPKSPKAKSEGEGEDGDENENEFMVERCYSFELTDDDMDEGNLDWEGYVDEEDVDMDLEDEDEDAEEDGWDDEDTDEETDEDEEVEIELKGLVGKKGAAASAPSGSATGPAEKLTSVDDGILSGDEDAEGEMEVDIEAFSDPSFNAELSSPTSVSSPALPLPPVESMISSFYVPPAPSVVPFPGAGFFSSGFPQQPQQQQQEEGHEQTSLDEPLPHQQVQENDQQQKQHRHPPPPLQIHIAPANQGGFFASPPPPSPILPLPPPRLETIRVGYLRQSELGVKVTGKGTPADRARAAQWAKGFVRGKRRSSRERESEVEENEEGEKRGRPRLRMMAFPASEKCAGDALPSALGSRTNNMGGLRLSLPSDVGVSSSPPPTSVVVDSVKCAETLDELDFGLKMGVHEVALPPSLSSTSSSVVTPIPAAAVEFVTADDEPHWDAFLASLDEKGGGDKAYQARMPDQLQQQQQEALQPELELASTNNHGNPTSPSSPPSSPGFTTPRPAAPPPTDPVFGLNTNIFDMSFVLDANSWFAAGASANGGAGLGESPAASGVVNDGQQGPIDVTSAAVGGTSTLSFALG